MPYKDPVKQKECTQRYYKEHKEELKIKNRIYCELNKKQIAENHKIYYSTHKQKINAYKKQWYLKNKIRILKLRKKYNIINRLKINKYSRKRRKTDIQFKLAHNLRNRILKVLKGTNKSKSTFKLLGCSLNELKQHLENKFTKGMNWNNYGRWEIDHIRPCASFDLSKPEEQLKCFHYTNLQPLWEKDNQEKRDKI
jgi:hypothetical protein